MTEADILALTYQDSCWVYRPQKTTLPSGESVFQKGLDGRQVYENIPCALSSPSGGKLGKKEPTASIDTDFLLFVRPEVEIEPGDTVKVIRLGREYLTEADLEKLGDALLDRLKAESKGGTKKGGKAKEEPDGSGTGELDRSDGEKQPAAAG